MTNDPGPPTVSTGYRERITWRTKAGPAERVATGSTTGARSRPTAFIASAPRAVAAPRFRIESRQPRDLTPEALPAIMTASQQSPTGYRIMTETSTPLTFDSLLDALDRDGRLVTNRGSQAMARCPLPGHTNGDLHPGLSITERDDKVLAYCHGLHLICYIELLDHYGFAHGDGALREPTRLDLLETYNYTDPEGRIGYRVLRFWDNDTNDKTFRQERPGPEGPIPNLDGVNRVPYNLPAVIEAIAADQAIVLVEGEKDVNTLGAYGIPATTVANGQHGWSKGDYAKWFAGATVVIVPDNGAIGYGIDAAKDLRRVAKTHLLTLPEDIGPKGDSTDFIIQHGHEAFVQLLNEAPEYTPEMARIPEDATESSLVAKEANVTADAEGVTVEWFEEQLRIKVSDFRYAGVKATALVDVWYSSYGHVVQSTRVDLHSGSQKDRLNTTINRGRGNEPKHPYIEHAFGVAIAYSDSPKQAVSVTDMPPEDLLHYEWMIEGFLPGGKGEEGATLLVADGETGKTWLSMGAAISVASGKPVFGRLSAQVVGKVLYLDWEGSPKKFRRRFGRIIAGARIPEDAVKDSLLYIRESSPFVNIVRRIRAMVQNLGITLIVIDSLRGAAKGTLKDDDTTEMFFNAVNSLGIPVFIIHHTNRENTTYGSAFIRNFARFMWVVPESHYIERDLDAGTGIKMLLMECDKDNEGSMGGQKIGMKIEWGLPEVYMTPISGRYAEMVARNPGKDPPLTDTLLELLEGERRWMSLDAIIASVNPDGAANPKAYRERVRDALGKMGRSLTIQARGERKNKEHAALGVVDGSAPWE